MADPILQLRDLRTYFHTDAGEARAVDGVSLDISRGETLALVGESGCGKSMTAMSILRLVPAPPGRIVGGSVMFEGRDLVAISEEEMRTIRGNDISMIFQEPMTSLNPVFKISTQIGGVLKTHRGMDDDACRDETIRLLKEVGIPAPEQRVDEYPHQLSGGMRQRVMIAMALACDPKVLIADEPTTALDVTVQAQILELLKRLQEEHNMAILLITHDLGVVAETADRVAVMYAGEIIEEAPVVELYENPSHPYTVGLFKALPGAHIGGTRLESIKGTVPPATRFPHGCRFHPRCPYKMAVCEDEPPNFVVAEAHTAKCWLHDKEVMAKEGKPMGIPDLETKA